MMKKLLLLLLPLLVARPIHAQLNAATCNLSDVVAKYNIATDGQTINIPAGNCSWASGTATFAKAVTFNGAGQGVTNITMGVPSAAINLTKVTTGPQRWQNLTFISANAKSTPKFVVVTGPWPTGQPIIFYNVTFNYTFADFVTIQTPGGVIFSHITYNGSSWDQVLFQAKAWGGSDPTGRNSWEFFPDSMGQKDTTGWQNIYLEDSTINNGSVSDCDDACRFVERHNFCNSCVLYNSHGDDSSNLGTRHFEIYDNTLVYPFLSSNGTQGCQGGGTTESPDNVGQFIWVRGGTGIMYNNNFSNRLSGQCGWGDKPTIKMELRGVMDDLAYRPPSYTTRSTCGNLNYPVPNQFGQNNNGTYPTSGGGYPDASYFTDPIYVWQNIGPGTAVGGFKIKLTSQLYSGVTNTCGVTWGTYFQWGRDGVDGTFSTTSASTGDTFEGQRVESFAKGFGSSQGQYIPFQYPHPLVSTLPTYSYPIKTSSNNRFFVDQNNVPWFMVADAMHRAINNMSTTDYATYLIDRWGKGFNSVDFFALCTSGTNCTTNGVAFDGTKPFNTGNGATSDISTPNSAYWAKVDQFINTANSLGMVVFLRPMPWGNNGPGTLFTSNGTTKVFNFGAFLGTRYKNSNIIWGLGQDFDNTSSNPPSATDVALMGQFMAGIKSTDSNHIMTVQNQYQNSFSQQACGSDATYAADMDFSFAYTYQETYNYVGQAYGGNCTGGKATMPVLMGESNYQGGNNPGVFGAGGAPAFVIREEMWWPITSGATGIVSGTQNVEHTVPNWQNSLFTDVTSNGVAATQIGYGPQLLYTLPWQNFTPDTNHNIIFCTAVHTGCGTINNSNTNLTTGTWMTAAFDGTGTAIAYTPVTRTISAAMTSFGGSTLARWYDPTTGKFTTIGTFTNTGTQSFTTPATAHADGTNDWVLVMTPSTGTPTAGTPTFSPAPGTYSSSQSVSLGNPSGTPVMCFTTNGATPATNGTTGCTTGSVYSSAIAVSVTTTIKAVAGGTGFNDSGVASGTYTISSPVTLSPTSQNFGSVNVSSSSSPVTFTLNNGSGSTATAITPTTTGGNSGDFTITNSGAGSCATGVGGANSLTAGASCTFTVTFSPSAAGQRSTTLSVSYSGGDGASPQTSALSGSGVGAAQLSLSPTSFTYPSTKVGVASSPHAFTLSNPGTASATISSIAFAGQNGNDFSETDNCGTQPATLAASGSCTINVTFTPDQVGILTGNLVVTDTPDSLSTSSTLNGTGTNCGGTVIGVFTLCGSSFATLTTATQLTAPYTPTPGNGVILHVGYCNTNDPSCLTTPTQTVTSISDNINNPETCFVASPHTPFTLDAKPTGVHDWQRYYEYFCPSVPTGVTGFTATLSAPATFLQVSPSEWIGISSTAFWENVDNGVGSTTTGLSASVTTSAPTTTQPDLIYAFLVNTGGTVTATPDPAYTCIQCNPQGDPGFISEAQSVTSTGNFTATSTWTTTAKNWFGVIAPLRNGPPSPILSFSVASPFSVGQVPQNLTGNAVGPITITNTGITNLVATAMTVSTAFYTLTSNTCGSPGTITNAIPGTGFTLTAGQTCTFNITFAPNATGLFVDTINVSDNTPSGTDSLVLNGTGTGPSAPGVTIFAGSMTASGQAAVK